MIKALNFLGLLPVSFSPVRTKNKFQSTPSSNIGLIAAAVLLIGLNGFLLMSYLFSVNNQSLQGYEMKQIQNKLAELEVENQKINFKVSEVSSMVSIQSDFLNSSYVAADAGKFLQVNQYTMK